MDTLIPCFFSFSGYQRTK